MRSLYSTFAATTIGIMMLSFLTAFFISNTYYQQYLKPENDEKNTQIAKEMATFIEGNPEVSINEYLENMAAVGYQLYLADDSGDGTFYGSEFREDALPNHVVENVLDGNIHHGMQEFPRETFVTGFFANELRNTIGIPLEYEGKKYALFMRPDIEKLFNEMHLLFGWLFLLTIVLSIIFVLIGTKYMVRPVTRLSAATKALSKGSYDIGGLGTKRKDELGELTKSFAQMAERIRQTENMRKDFISNITHDINSPLSNIKGYSALLRNELDSDGKAQEYLSIINGESNRISAMTNQLLLLSSLDHEDHLLKKKIYDVGSQLRRLIHRYEWRIDEGNLMLSHDIQDVVIAGDETLLEAVWDNLLSNAIKYNSEFGEVGIELIEHEDDIEVSFRDTGIGMGEEAKQHIFERFYREDSSRSGKVQGSGLGLSIVQKVVQLHNGTISVQSNGHGTVFRVVLPKK
ncbi:sensor histidine kinase [Salinicoccus roseus]|uniref:sensor histidine kinase n=1 Tax=Salinicoccus roseus TaxID=45670 RepID=UPI000F50C76E|nr:HAMP domain-containing sensor histidine kinase [Salinicoccus roseus]RPE54238.1 signal transduction histidine kinase [Salinicoccus roseus]GGA67077.1 two-component sensor histidine kinase [Salinicoccus roseus]